MKICAAQTRPKIGNIAENISAHKKLAELAASRGADIVVFPELSLTGYEPKLAKDLATTANDSRFNDFQKICDQTQITIGAGIPIPSKNGIQIGMLIFQPNTPRQVYCKQRLHSDELPYFVESQTELFLNLKDHRIAPAICYESLLPEHSEKAFKNGATTYIASVAKSARGVEKALYHYPETARKYSMPVLMSNCVGPCDDFVGVGGTAAWNSKGQLVGQLDSTSEGLVIFDTEIQTAETETI